MKKVVILFLLGIMITGCASNGSKQDETKKDEVENKTKQSNDQDDKSERHKLTQDEFIIETFASYGYETPSRDTWIVKNEEDNKVAVIIKEFEGKKKPDISKLIFLWNGNSEEAVILHVLVRNNVVYDNDN